VEEAIDALVDADGCDEVVLVAHSQGAVVAFDALTSGGIAHIDRIHRFITVGAALNKAWTLEEGSKALNGALPATVERWVDLWANYDPVPGGPLKRRFPVVKSERLTNAINVLTDHDIYWRNPEQFLSRVAQEIDAPETHGPTEPPRSSRFWPGDDRQAVLVERRANRVHALVFWRCAAFGLFVVAVFDRLRAATGPGSLPGLDRLARDGRAMWAAVRAAPGVDVPLKPVEAIGAWVDRTLANLGWAWEPIGMVTVALVGFAVIMALGYLLAGLFFYRYWDTRETNDVAQPPRRRLPFERDIWLRITTGLLYVALPAMAIAYWP
jgi:pimeloyl-ACP methyl ester carboxylesterase